jgi:hypothetical protein
MIERCNTLLHGNRLIACIIFELIQAVVSFERQKGRKKEKKKIKDKKTSTREKSRTYKLGRV